jgi:predicted nucleotidyltransferase
MTKTTYHKEGENQVKEIIHTSKLAVFFLDEDQRITFHDNRFAEACGDGSRARGTAGPASDIDLLITAPDAWLEGRNRFEVLNQLWGLLARADVSLDLLLYSERECEERRQWRTHARGDPRRGDGLTGRPKPVLVMPPCNRQPGPGAGHHPSDPGKRMVGRVLTGNGITRYGDGHYSLIGAEELSDSERDALLQLCRQEPTEAFQVCGAA